ncbi:MAG: uroporphyrinogen decarboxylase [Planctomycetota bacterium]|jgi:uroporphyrinogen decarboxylase
MPDKRDRFLNACLGRDVDATPVWLMRQAGRYQPWYMKIREKMSFIELCRDSDVCAEVTVRAADELDADAAILFSDILLILEGLGVKFQFTDDGPRHDKPLRDPNKIAALKPADTRTIVPFAFEAIEKIRKELNGRIPLIGFSGAPFTLAAYLIEGWENARRRGFEDTRAFFFEEPSSAMKLMEVLAATVTDYVNAQIDAGAQAIQLFDTHAGVLAPQDYKRFVHRWVCEVVSGIKRKGKDGKTVPVILSAVGSGHLLELFATSGVNVIAVDWRVNIDEACERIGREHTIMGNLDPAALLGPKEEIRTRVMDIIERVGGRNGHVFNLGHGVLPQTDPAAARYLIDCVHELSARERNVASGETTR